MRPRRFEIRIDHYLTSEVRAVASFFRAGDPPQISRQPLLVARRRLNDNAFLRAHPSDSAVVLLVLHKSAGMVAMGNVDDDSLADQILRSGGAEERLPGKPDAMHEDANAMAEQPAAHAKTALPIIETAGGSCPALESATLDCQKFVGTLVTAALTVSCHQGPASITVGVIFDNSRRLGTEWLGESDVALLKRAALDRLQRAYTGFGVRFREGAFGTRTITVVDTSDMSDWPRSRTALGAAGVTYPAARSSSVRVDVLFRAELTAAHCQDVGQCAKTRPEILEGLGRGIGATAAHELGHQGGFGFVTDSPCDDCYDGRTSVSYAHFFGEKHWSETALTRMKRVLPPA